MKQSRLSILMTSNLTNKSCNLINEENIFKGTNLVCSVYQDRHITIEGENFRNGIRMYMYDVINHLVFIRPLGRLFSFPIETFVVVR